MKLKTIYIIIICLLVSTAFMGLVVELKQQKYNNAKQNVWWQNDSFVDVLDHKANDVLSPYSIYVSHDNKRGATCYQTTGTGGGLSCIPDSQLINQNSK